VAQLEAALVVIRVVKLFHPRSVYVAFAAARFPCASRIVGFSFQSAFHAIVRLPELADIVRILFKDLCILFTAQLLL
jgi:hypothetical protein